MLSSSFIQPQWLSSAQLAYLSNKFSDHFNDKQSKNCQKHYKLFTGFSWQLMLDVAKGLDTSHMHFNKNYFCPTTIAE